VSSKCGMHVVDPFTKLIFKLVACIEENILEREYLWKLKSLKDMKEDADMV